MVSTFTSATLATLPMLSCSFTFSPLIPYHSTEFMLLLRQKIGRTSCGCIERKNLADRWDSRRDRRVRVLRGAAGAARSGHWRGMDWQPYCVGAVPANIHRPDTGLPRPRFPPGLSDATGVRTRHAMREPADELAPTRDLL